MRFSASEQEEPRLSHAVVPFWSRPVSQFPACVGPPRWKPYRGFTLPARVAFTVNTSVLASPRCTPYPTRFDFASKRSARFALSVASMSVCQARACGRRGGQGKRRGRPGWMPKMRGGPASEELAKISSLLRHTKVPHPTVRRPRKQKPRRRLQSLKFLDLRNRV